MDLKLKLAFSAALALLALGFVFSSHDVEAFPGNNSSHYVCYHNDMPYALVFVQFGNPPVCPEDEEAWDSQDGFDCSGPYPCAADRHIDCEFTNEPGGL